jgi:L-iditol 2-dehydrogenase
LLSTKLSTEQLHYGEVKVLGAFHTTPLHFRKALHLISSRMIDVRPFVIRRMRLEEIREAFETLATSKSEIKIAFKPKRLSVKS